MKKIIICQEIECHLKFVFVAHLICCKMGKKVQEKKNEAVKYRKKTYQYSLCW